MEIWRGAYLFILSVVNVCESAMEGFIVGGDYAKINHFPHSTYLGVSCQMVGKVENWGCGGSIVNQRIVLTAAHCLENCLKTSHVSISVGSETKGDGAIGSAKTFMLHPKYDEVLVKNDIALIRTKKSIKFNKNVKRVALMTNPPYKEPAEIAGWGLVDEKKNMGTKHLKFAKQKIWRYDMCVKVLKSMHDGTLCANSGNYDTKEKFGFASEGDSGSALVIRGYIAVGLVSFKLPTISPSVVIYTDVAYFYKWIAKTSKKLYCQK